MITKKRMFYETLEEVLPNMNIYITYGTTQTMLPLESISTIDISEPAETEEGK